MNHVIQEWKMKNLETVDKDTIRIRITRLLDDADKLGKFTRDMKKPEFCLKQKAKFDVVFDIAKSPVKVVKAGPSNQTPENDDDMVNGFLVSLLK